MVKEDYKPRLGIWTDQLLSKGKTAFTVEQAREAFKDLSGVAVKRSLDRLSVKGKIVSIHKGYYLIVPPQYAAKGILPPSLFIDGLMKHLERPYYVGLLNAAAFYGAAHQQPQEYAVFTGFPVLRPTQKKGIKINYVSISSIRPELLEQRKTETGYLTISSPALTAADLVQFEKRTGGLARSATVLSELAEAIRPGHFTEAFFRQASTATIQRLGYLLDKVLHQQELAAYILQQSQKLGLTFFSIPLKTSSPVKGFGTDDKWKVIINTKIEIDQ
jgi:predicted transcriptional regulator of viral defense system